MFWNIEKQGYGLMDYALYVLKKIISVLVYPTGTALLLLFAGLTLLVKKRKRAGTFLIIVATMVLLIFSMGWSGYALLKSLENEAGPYADPSHLEQAGRKYIVVLGGTGIYDDLFPPDSWESVNPRFLESVRLWHAVPGAMLVMSGGPGSSSKSMEALAVRFGIPKEAMILETSAMDTASEAHSISKLVGKEPFALVTSAFHIPRALQQFREAGTNPIPCPCDFRTTRRPPTHQLLMPSGAGLYYSEVALKEYYGRLFYWVKSLI
jgi:uncharacterized SAM-binding protein YcdF (DUF218 family)